MANNRLYIKDPVSGERVMLAKSLGGGWYIPVGQSEKVEAWLEGRDRASCYGNVSDMEPTVLILEDENNEKP
jgi:hypothetical protein